MIAADGEACTEYDGKVAATNNGTGTGVNGGITGNYGWIDRSDGDWGDTYKVNYYKFSLTGTAADVTLSFQAKSNAFRGPWSDSRLYPLCSECGIRGRSRFSPGSILLRDADCNATPGCTATEGSFRSLASFRITNDADPAGVSPSVFSYIGLAYDGTDVTLPGTDSPLYDNNP